MYYNFKFRKVYFNIITFHISLLVPGSMPVVGSSKNKIGGLPNSAMAT